MSEWQEERCGTCFLWVNRDGEDEGLCCKQGVAWGTSRYRVAEDYACELWQRKPVVSKALEEGNDE